RPCGVVDRRGRAFGGRNRVHRQRHFRVGGHGRRIHRIHAVHRIADGGVVDGRGGRRGCRGRAGGRIVGRGQVVHRGVRLRRIAACSERQGQCGDGGGKDTFHRRGPLR